MDYQMKRGMPVIVYLDTQDYINIRQHGNDAEISKVVAYIKAKIFEGKISVYYSPMIVLEFLTRPGEGFIQDRIERGRLVKEICGQNTFSIEFSSLKAGMRSDGNWIGSQITDELSVKRLIKKSIESARKEIAIDLRLNRETRRKINSDSYIIAQMKSGESRLFGTKADFGSLPVSEEFMKGRYIERYLQKEISEAAVQRAFTKWIADPEEFCRVYYQYKDNENAIDQFFHPTISAMQLASQHAEKFCAQALEFEKSRIQNRRDLIDAGFESNEAKRLTPQFRPDLNLDANRLKLENVFGKGRAEHFLSYLLAIFKGKTSWLSSDFGDLFHLIYSYECDLFRCDKKMANIMADCNVLKDRLVPSFFELPSRIEAMLANQT